MFLQITICEIDMSQEKTNRVEEIAHQESSPTRTPPKSDPIEPYLPDFTHV
jgi:hypothetical protein